jgi:C1A family cysteine protease
MSITVDIDLRSSLGPARDQGRRPTCLAFAATAAHEASRSSTEYLSVEYLFYFGVQRSHRNPHRGLNQVSVSTALKEDGQPRESAWPYSLATPQPSSWHPPHITETLYKSTLVFSSRAVSEVHTLVRGSILVVLVVSVTTAMYGPDDQAVIRARPTDTTTANRHALLAVGSGHASDGGYLLVRNSWGPTWGDQGHAWLPDSYLAANLRDSGIISKGGQTK